MQTDPACGSQLNCHRPCLSLTPTLTHMYIAHSDFGHHAARQPCILSLAHSYLALTWPPPLLEAPQLMFSRGPLLIVPAAYTRAARLQRPCRPCRSAQTPTQAQLREDKGAGRQREWRRGGGGVDAGLLFHSWTSPRRGGGWSKSGIDCMCNSEIWYAWDW